MPLVSLQRSAPDASITPLHQLTGLMLGGGLAALLVGFLGVLLGRLFHAPGFPATFRSRRVDHTFASTHGFDAGGRFGRAPGGVPWRFVGASISCPWFPCNVPLPTRRSHLCINSRV